MDILDTQILFQQGSFMKIRRWWAGKHPNLGIIIWGLTGVETVQEISIIKPQFSYMVSDNEFQGQKQTT